MEQIGVMLLRAMDYNCNWDRLFTLAIGVASLSLGLIALLVVGPPLFFMGEPYRRPWLARTVAILLLVILTSLLVAVLAGGMGAWSTPETVVIRAGWAQVWQGAVGVAMTSLALFGVGRGYIRWGRPIGTSLARGVRRLLPVLVGVSVVAVLVGLVAISKGEWQCPAYERHLTALAVLTHYFRTGGAAV